MPGGSNLFDLQLYTKKRKKKKFRERITGREKRRGKNFNFILRDSCSWIGIGE
jgi:hypothetical protein